MEIETPTFDVSVARAINDAGVIVGWSINKDGNYRATIFNSAPNIDLGTLGGTNSYAYAVSPVRKSGRLCRNR